MKLIPSASGYDSEKRSIVYECSVQYLDDDVMRPRGYVLVQLDWQNVVYLHKHAAAAVGLPNGVDVQAAYHVGYATRAKRAQRIPWGEYEDKFGGTPRRHGIDHLLYQDNYTLRGAQALKWARASEHRQPEGVAIGCLHTRTTIEWLPSARPLRQPLQHTA